MPAFRSIRIPALFLALAVLHTWPLASAPHRLSLNHNADAQLNAWIVSWIAHILPTDPGRLWHGNIFQPGEAALTFSEPLVVPAIAGAPVWWLSQSPVLLFNLLLIAGLAATGWATTVVMRRWTGSLPAALLAGAFFAFNTHLLTRLPHLQAAHAWGLWLIWGAVWLRLTGGGRWWMVPAGVALTAATSLHWLVFGIIGAAVMPLAERRHVREVARVAVEGLAGLLIAMPILWPYLVDPVSRPLDQVAQFSATPAGWLTSLAHAHRWWTQGWFTVDTDVWFPGLTILALAIVGLAASWRHQPLARWAALLLVAGVVCSLGTATPVYEWLYQAFPPMRGIRAATRFGVLAYAGLATLAAFGLARLLKHRSMAPRAVTAATAALALLTAESLHAPIATTPWTGSPSVYALLRDEPAPVLLAEMPFYPAAAAFEGGEYVINATAHWQPVMNGYSGRTPMSYRRHADSLWYFPEPGTVDTLRQAGATHVLVHLERYGDRADQVVRDIEDRPEFRLLAAGPGGHRLYRLVWE